MPGQTVQTQIRLLLISAYTVCHSVCIVWTHYSMVEPHSSNFGVITTNILGVRIFRKFTLHVTSSSSASFSIAIIGVWATTWQNQQNERAPSEDSDQPGHTPSLNRVFALRMKKAWVLGYPMSAQRRLWSDWGWCPGWSESSLGTHSFCWFCQVAAHFMSLLLKRQQQRGQWWQCMCTVAVLDSPNRAYILIDTTEMKHRCTLQDMAT